MAGKYCEIVSNYLKEQKVNHSIDKDNCDRIDFSFDADHIGKVVISLFFDDELDMVAIRAFNVGNLTYTKDTKQNLLEVINAKNTGCSWVKFYLDDEDGTITAAIDAKINEDTAGSIVEELFCRMIYVVDEAYTALQLVARGLGTWE